MSNFQDFLHTRIWRNPTTWIVAIAAAIYGGLDMYWIREGHRARGDALQWHWLWLDQTVDFTFGAVYQLVLLGCSIWLICGWMENSSAWIRQSLVFALFLGLNWLSQFV